MKTGETPYSASITQVYEDGVEKPVQIEGDLRHTSLTDIRVRYIDRQYIETGLPAPAKPPVKPVTVKNNNQPKKDMLVSSQQSINNDNMVVPLGTPMSMVSTDTNKESGEENEGENAKTTTEELPATLYPPTVPTSAKPNPLRKFYPVEDDPPREKVMFSAAKYEHSAAGIKLRTVNGDILIALTLVTLISKYLYILG